MHSVIALLCKLIPTPGRYSGFDLTDLKRLLWEVIPREVHVGTRERGPRTTLIRDEEYAVAVRRFFRSYPECIAHHSHLIVRAQCGDEEIAGDCLRIALGDSTEYETMEAMDALGLLGSPDAIAALAEICESASTRRSRVRAATQLTFQHCDAGAELIKEEFRLERDSQRAALAACAAVFGDLDAYRHLIELASQTDSMSFGLASLVATRLCDPALLYENEETISHAELMRRIDDRKARPWFRYGQPTA